VGYPALTLWVCTEGNLTAASGATNEESIDRDIEIFLLKGLLARVELAPTIDVFAAVGTFHGKRGHQSDRDDLGTLLAQMLGGAPDRRRIEVGRVVLGQDLSLGHVGGGSVTGDEELRKIRLLEEEKWRWTLRTYRDKST
jgi:hypothetical protein